MGPPVGQEPQLVKSVDSKPLNKDDLLSTKLGMNKLIKISLRTQSAQCHDAESAQVLAADSTGNESIV